MDFFARIIQQPPIPDKDKNDTSQLSDEFTVSKGRTLRGFNDDVSQIEVGSEQINEDSFNQIKKQHKLLSGRQQSDGRSKPFNQSKEYSAQQQFQNPPQTQLQANKKDSKRSKLSLESKLLVNPRMGSQLLNLHREYSVGARNLPQSITYNLNKNKKVQVQIMNHLAELKRIKEEIKGLLQEQGRKCRKLIQTSRIGVEIQIKKRMAALLTVQQSVSSKRTQNNQQQLLKKLKQTQNLVKDLQASLDQLGQQNQTLQQKVFDLQQKIVGVDLQVEERFQRKRKQLQKKIYQQVKSGITLSQEQKPQNLAVSKQNNSTVNHNSSQPSAVVQNLISQNQFLEAKIKSYEAILLEADQIRQMKSSLEQREVVLSHKQQELKTRAEEFDKNAKETNKRSIDLTYAEESLNRKIHELKDGLKLKEDQLISWEEELKKKARLITQRAQLTYGQNHMIPTSQSNQAYNVTFQKPPQLSYQQRPLLSTPSQDQLTCKLQRLNLQNRKFSPKNSIQLQTFRNTRLDSPKNIQTQRFPSKDTQGNIVNINKGNNDTNPKTQYDPRKHEEYEKYDMNDRQRFRMNNVEYYENLTERLNSPRGIQATSTGTYRTTTAKQHFPVNDPNRTRNRLGSFKLTLPNDSKRPSAQFYQPTVKNTFRYEPQYSSTKPLSSPLSHPQRHQFKQSNPSLSPHHRQHNTIAYSKGSNNTSSHARPKEKYYTQHDRSGFSRSSKDSFGKTSHKVSFQGYDMNKSKNKFEVGNLASLGNKIEILKSELKSQIDSIL